MYRAPTYLLLLLLLLFTSAASADPILTFDKSSRVSPRDNETFTAIEPSSLSVNAFRSMSAERFTPPGLQQRWAEIKSGGLRSRSSESASIPPGVNLTLGYIKDDVKPKKYKGGKDKQHDEDEDYDHHVLPEPPLLATLGMGLALLLFRLKRSN